MLIFIVFVLSKYMLVLKYEKHSINKKIALKLSVAVTGDHNFWNMLAYSNERTLDSLSVPFYLYIPDALKPKNIDTSVFGFHLDIMPTLYNLSLSDCEYMAMGQNLLSEKAKDNIIFMDFGIIMNKNVVVRYNFHNGKSEYYNRDKNKNREIESSIGTNEHEELIKHYLSSLAVSEYLIKNTGK